jgi:uncharacterized damage-inducible protein DinB
MLSVLGVRFEHVNIFDDADAAAFLESNGLRVPVVEVDDEIIVGFDEQRLRKALGLADPERLVQELPWLVGKYDLVFRALMRAVRQLDTVQLETFYPERGQTVREHVLHIISAVEGAYLSHERGTFGIEDLTRATDDWYRTTAEEICEYAEQVRCTVTAFLESGDHAKLNRVVRSHYGGEVTVAEVLQLVLRHSAHHLSQLYWFMEGELHVAPDRPLAAEDWDGIEVPARLFIGE